jgi:hypothetical protein
MASISLPIESLYEASLQQGQVRHAVKTALTCCLATGLSYLFHLPAGQLAPVFVFLLLTMGMPSPRLNSLVALCGITISAIVSALILLAFRDALFLYVAVTLLWIFTVLLFSNWFSLPASMGAMVSALGIFVFFQGNVGDALRFYTAYGFNWLIAGFSVVVVNTLIWPNTTRKVFVERLAAVYAHLEQKCDQAARWIRSGESMPPADPPEEWTPFRRLRQVSATELRRARDTSNPFARLILACRALNLRLWFFNRAIAPVAPFLLAEARQQLARLLNRCADRLHALLEGALYGKPVLSDEWRVTTEEEIAHSSIATRQLSVPLLAHGIHIVVLRRLVHDLQTATASHAALFARFRNGLADERVVLSPAVAANARLLDVHSLRSSTKLVVIILLLLLEEGLLGFPGGSQVAFFATFFASTGNLGRQNKTDLVGLAGLLGGFIYGVVAAFLTSRMPHLALLLALVFLGEFLASLTFQRLPRYGAAGLQAGLAIPFAYLATSGPEWGSFTTVQTRFWGLVVAGFTAVVVHAYLWPVLPIRQLRASIAAALRATAASLTELFGPARPAWEGAPPSLGQTVTRSRDLLDDARYLPGSEHADPSYENILTCLQEIDANLEYVHFLIGLEGENPLRRRFFQVIGDYAEQARSNLETVARQFRQPARRAACVEPIRWDPHTSDRWESADHDVGPAADRQTDIWRPAVIAHCLDQVARAVEKISVTAWEINRRNLSR